MMDATPPARMKLLVIGSGGREHALAWKLARSPRVHAVFVAPGNAGTAAEPGVQNLALSDPAQLAEFAEREQIALTVVGPEAPLAAGIVDFFQARGLRIFGPTRAAAQLESSKAFAKAFLERHRIPTGRYAVFSEAGPAHRYITAQGAPIVIKADGLAAGKGVVVALTEGEAHAAVDQMLQERSLGEAGGRLVIEEFLPGEEASFIVIADGTDVLALATSQDHKRLADGDQGPNTGGMGAYSPAPVVTPAVHEQVMRQIIRPTLEGLRAEGIHYRGFLYAGLMIDPQGAARVLEFNCRLGDPETQPIMMRLESDLADLLEAALEGRLPQAEARWDRRVAIGVVLAAAGYPEQPRRGDPIGRLPGNAADLHVFHAGTERRAGRLLTAGGRVACITALGQTLQNARERAYRAVGEAGFEGMQFRTDIGSRGLLADREHAKGPEQG